MAFLKNAWYVAALSTEVDGTALFNRTILGDSVLVYRREDGSPVALRNRCPHRFVPLHLGKRDGDNVVCPYHGLKFDCAGKCVESPHGDGHIPKAAVVHAYPVEERHGFIWIWTGDVEKTDASLIPDYSLLDGGPANGKGYAHMTMAAHYELIIDNIMDLSHVDHVHGPLLNTAGLLSPQIPQVKENGTQVSVRWDWHQCPPQGFFAPFLPKPTEGADQHVTVQWTAPSTILLTVGAMQGTKNPEEGLISWDHHLMTPETETTTHYFFASRRNWLTEDADFNKFKMEATVAAFNTEDKPIIEAVQKEMNTTDFWSLKPVLLSGDPAPVRARRVLQGLIAAENK